MAVTVKFDASRPVYMPEAAVLFYLPHFIFGSTQPPQDRLRSKLGGIPWGLPESKWPVCGHCNYAQCLIAQIAHEPPMIDLGRDAVLHMFNCEHCGGDFEADCIILDRSKLGEGLTQPPGARREQPWGELWIHNWSTEEDAVEPDQESAHYDYILQLELAVDQGAPEGDNTKWRTKAGGVPYWTGNGVRFATGVSVPPFEFLFQIDQLVFVGGGPPAEQDIWEMGTENGARYVTFANFGSDGTAFVFIDRTTSPPKARWRWMR